MAVLHADAVVAPMERDPDLWFGDGSIVVVAQGTGFRVHTSLLSRASPIFRDVFALPQPAADSVNADTVQGAPVIRVSDCAHDMRCMLHAIYDRKYLDDMVPDIPFAVLAALVRLGHKYELTDIPATASRYLEQYFTDDLQRWVGETRKDFMFSGCVEADTFELVNLARQTGRTALLPAALYRCCLFGVPTILQGARRSDGSAARLGKKDVERSLVARERLLLESCAVVDVFTGVNRAAMACKSKAACEVRLETIAYCLAKSAPSIVRPRVFASLRVRLDEALPCDHWKGLCPDCRIELAGRYEDKQREVWRKIPSIFRLSDSELEGTGWAATRRSAS